MKLLVISVTKCFIFDGMSQVSLHALRYAGAELALVASHGLVCAYGHCRRMDHKILWGLSRAWLVHWSLT